jgi:hypothetical protein
MARYPLTTQENNVKENVYEHQPGNSRSDLLHIIPSGGLIKKWQGRHFAIQEPT